MENRKFLYYTININHEEVAFMLEQIDLTKKMSKKEYKARMDVLETELSRLQRSCKNEKIPVMICLLYTSRCV